MHDWLFFLLFFLNRRGKSSRRSSCRHRKVPSPANNSLSHDPGQSSDTETRLRCCEDDVLIADGYHGDHQGGDQKAGITV